VAHAALPCGALPFQKGFRGLKIEVVSGLSANRKLSEPQLAKHRDITR
jgi:hypothetical protein